MEAQKLYEKKKQVQKQIHDIISDFLKDVGECSIEGEIGTHHSELREGQYVNVQINIKI